MKVIAVSMGSPRELEWQGTTVTTSIWKTPVEGTVRVLELGLVGDHQSDRRVHGGPEKAVCAYPAEHYPRWREELAGMDLEWGAFGENLTVEGLTEDAVRAGDRLRIGTAEFRVTKPRFPCFKLGIKFGDQEFLPRFLVSGRSGFYLAVTREGEVRAGDAITRLEEKMEGPTISELVAARAREA